MPILWFEQHVKMNEDIANEVKLILKLPHIGQMLGTLFVVIGSITIIFIPLKNYLSHQCCSKHSKVCDLRADTNVNADPPPEVSPLITEKPKYESTLNEKEEVYQLGFNNNIILRS